MLSEKAGSHRSIFPEQEEEGKGRKKEREQPIICFPKKTSFQGKFVVDIRPQH